MPGTLQEKVDPYLRPLYDALFDMLDVEKVDKMLERNVIEVAPLAFMRGRTLNDAFIILDEAQNTTIEQMKMFLTRMGNNSKAVITGDITQIDLPNPRKSGLLDAINVLDGVEGISFLPLRRVATWCAIRWCSALCAPMKAPGRSSRSCRWKAQSRWALRRETAGRTGKRSIRPSRSKTGSRE